MYKNKISITLMLILTIGFMHAFAEGFGQKVSLNLNKVSLHELMNQIQKQTGYDFLVNQKLLNSIDNISVNVNHQDLNAVLTQCFQDLDLNFEIRDKTIFIISKNETPAAKRIDLVQTSQQQTLTGVVKNTQGNPIPGVSVTVEGHNKFTSTNINGNFTLDQVEIGQTITFSIIGYTPFQQKIHNFTPLNITLNESIEDIDEVVVVGYGTQKRVSVTGAISSVSEKEIAKAPSVGVTNIIGARVAGVSMLQSSGQPGGDAASLLVRGQSAVYIVDGIQRSINEIDPNEIASVSVLKDATSAAIYGLDASAVIIVTTKRGSLDKTKITYNGKSGISENTNQLEWLDGPGYAFWYNKARELDGDLPLFTSEQVQKMKDGIDGWGNTNWYDEVFGRGTNMHHNVSATGGNNKVNFFTSIGAFKQNGNVDRHNFERYNLRSNVDARITDHVKMEFGIAGRVEDRSNPRYTANPGDWHNIPQQAVRALPYIPKTVPFEGEDYYTSTRTASSPVSPLAAISESGYGKSNNTYVESNFSLIYDVHGIEGLKAKFTGAYDARYQFAKSLAIPFATMLAALPNSTTEQISYTKFTDNSGNASITESAFRSTNVVTQTSLNYDRVFGKHSINALGLAETRNSFNNTLGGTGHGLDFLELDELDNITNQSGAGQERIPSLSGRSRQSRLIGFVGRLNYEYDNRYLAEITYRRDGSYLFSGMSGSRWVNLPAATLGWRVDQEDWFHSSIINSLKFRGGIGKSATSAVDAFQYLDLMTIQSNSVILGGSSQAMVYASTLGNPNLGWAKALSYNAGVDINAWNGLLGLEFDYFYKYEYDLLTSVAGAYPPSMGGYYFSIENKNKKDYRGFDFTITHNNQIGDFQYGVKLLASYTKRRWLYYAGDSENTPDYRKLTGKEVGSQLGFIAEGLFQTLEEIENSPTIVGSPVLPGYIKYKDRNGDGKISYDQDMGYVGKSAYPNFQSSLNLNAAWKGFDFDILLQSGLGRTVALTGVYPNSVMDNTAFTRMFYHGGNTPAFVAENSWTPENTNADFPRLSLVTVSTNNAYSSTFWYRSGDYLRLKSFQIGYTVPTNVMKSIGLGGLRVYAEGSNIFTFSELTKYNIDPEQPGVNNGYYPQQKTVTLGLNLTL